MKQLRKKLSILLVCQLVLAAGLWGMAHHRQATQGRAEPLLTFEKSKVDRLTVKRGEDQTELVKSEGNWTLPGFHNLPVEKAKLDELLTDLGELKATELVATTESSHQRLEVAPDKAVAEVHLYAGDEELAHLWVGKSPSFGKQYVRLDGKNDVFAVRWSGSALQARGSAWFDRGLLASGKLKEIKFPDMILTLENGIWKSDQLKLDQKRVKELVSLLENLQVFDVSDEDIEPDFTLSATTENGEQRTYHFSQKGGEHTVLREDHGVRFKLPQSIAEKLRGVDVQTLVSTDEEEQKAEE